MGEASLGGNFAQNAVEVAVTDEHAARLGALVAGNDPAPLEHVDESPGPGVADAQASLDERNGGGLGLDNDLDCAVEEGILVRIELPVLALVLARARRLEERLVELLFPLSAALLDDEGDLLLAHVGALDALET